MAKQIDKEALKKNLFWILLSTFFVLWLAAVVVVKVSASDAKKKAWEGAKGGIQSALSAGPKTPAFLTPWEKHGKKFHDQKDKLWQEAWKQQARMYTWPDNMPYNVRPLYFDDPFGRGPDGKPNADVDAANRILFRDHWYAQQFASINVAPAEFLKSMDDVFPRQVWSATEHPTAEEIWLAQEDFWIRGEMLAIVRYVLNSVALCRDVTPKEELEKIKKRTFPARRVFRNTNWEISLEIKDNPTLRRLVIGDQSTIKNIHPTQRTQVVRHPRSTEGLPFLMVQQGRNLPKRPQLYIASEPLAYGKEAKFKVDREGAVDAVDLAKDFQLEQVLDWEISPVRRIDALDVPRQSHRTVTMQLKVNEELKKLEPEAKDDSGGGGGGGGGGAIGGMGGMGGMIGGPPPGAGGPPPGAGGPPPGAGSMGGPGGKGGGGDGAATGDVTKVNKIPRQRYIQITPQARHIPIAMRLVVEQNHINDVLTAVANSTLRIQITQVAFHHVRDVARAKPGTGGVAEAKGGMGGEGDGMGGMPGGMPGVGGPPPAAGGPPPMGGGSMGGPPPMSGGFGRTDLSTPRGAGKFAMPGVTTPAKEGESQFVDNSRLVELSIYGIAALYERFPPKPKAAEQPAGTPGTTTPGAVTPTKP